MTLLEARKNGSHAYHDVEGVYSHIFDPNERRRMALAEIDKAPFSWYHVRLIAVTGVGFFTDAYSVSVFYPLVSDGLLTSVSFSP
jgi:MFS transporter, PHS family, inorganic phosphate transporter